MMKPLRASSNGREAFSGSSLRSVARAFIWLKPAIDSGSTADSAPPVIITSASPCLMNRKASPMQWAPVAQAVTPAVFGPLALCSIEMKPGARLMSILGMKRGDIFRTPFFVLISCASVISSMPPMPLPNATPVLTASSSFSGCQLASFKASLAATMEYWMNGAICWAFFFPRTLSALNSPSSLPRAMYAAICVGSPSNFGSVNFLMPVLPSSTAFHELSTSYPSGVTRPTPVITTRRVGAGGKSPKSLYDTCI
mmetsp:Transcript_38492/g.67930  ORF Transcript_38492/g.67930 Transcript_38492/m.67930 type:complete len:254 (-) Transcript_38492:211-972(-)